MSLGGIPSPASSSLRHELNRQVFSHFRDHIRGGGGWFHRGGGSAHSPFMPSFPLPRRVPPLWTAHTRPSLLGPGQLGASGQAGGGAPKASSSLVPCVEDERPLLCSLHLLGGNSFSLLGRMRPTTEKWVMEALCLQPWGGFGSGRATQGGERYLVFRRVLLLSSQNKALRDSSQCHLLNIPWKPPEEAGMLGLGVQIPAQQPGGKPCTLGA